MRRIMGHSHVCKVACILFAVYSAACTGKSPAAPTPEPGPPPAPATAAAIFLAPDSWDMPVGGGALEVIIRTSANTVGNHPAPNVLVALTASSGTLSDTAPQTDSTGHARVTWTGTSSATLRARAGDAEGVASIRVPAAAPTPTPPSGPPSAPGPPPPPPPPPADQPPPPPPPPPARPAGDLVATITATPPNPDANQTVTFSIAIASSTGSAVPAILRYTWDVSGDRLPDRWEATPTASYPAGTVQVMGEVYTADNREVRTTLALTVGVTPALSATMTVAPSAVGVGETTTLTANVTPAGNVGTLSYGWDVDGNGSIDQTTATNSTTTSYSTIGTKAPKVTVTGSRGPTTTATGAVSVTAPALSISGLRVSGTQTTGSLLTFTATVSAASGTVPSSMTFRWEFGNGLEVVTGASPNSINHTYATRGTYDVKVTVTAPDGRTATDTIKVTVS